MIDTLGALNKHHKLRQARARKAHHHHPPTGETGCAAQSEVLLTMGSGGSPHTSDSAPNSCCDQIYRWGAKVKRTWLCVLLTGRPRPTGSDPHLTGHPLEHFQKPNQAM